MRTSSEVKGCSRLRYLIYARVYSRVMSYRFLFICMKNQIYRRVITNHNQLYRQTRKIEPETKLRLPK
jgi:hypothetical protein